MSEKKVVSIRGIDEDLYRRATVFARETGKTIGEIINESLRLLLSLADFSSKSISVLLSELKEGLIESGLMSVIIKNLDEVSLNERDLKESDRPIVLTNIGRVFIENNVPFELFDKKIQAVISCGELNVPRNYPKVKVLSKCYYVKKINYI